MDEKSKDKSSLTIDPQQRHEERPEQTRVVNSFSASLLLTESPLWSIVLIVGSATSQEVLWNFSRFKDKRRVSLKHNPHFYKDLPRSPEAYGTRFQADSIHDFEDVDKVYVLTDTTRRVYLETPQKTRSFGNFWVLNGTILFKGSGGQLEGHTLPMIKPSDSPVNSAAAIPVWKQVIHLMVEFQDIDILISTRPDPLRDGWIKYSPSVTDSDVSHLSRVPVAGDSSSEPNSRLTT
ncbi:hypothetical protein BGW80DRAFT_1455296 [Lactifluus volemus]|nr:hypothetical protein BGW80DRAFT_1455296 [Lactifluus volemus]